MFKRTLWSFGVFTKSDERQFKAERARAEARRRQEQEEEQRLAAEESTEEEEEKNAAQLRSSSEQSFAVNRKDSDEAEEKGGGKVDVLAALGDLQSPKPHQTDILSRMPHPVAVQILTMLPPQDISRASSVSRSWAGLASSNAVWNRAREVYNEMALRHSPANADEAESKRIMENFKVCLWSWFSLAQLWRL